MRQPVARGIWSLSYGLVGRQFAALLSSLLSAVHLYGRHQPTRDRFHPPVGGRIPTQLWEDLHSLGRVVACPSTLTATRLSKVSQNQQRGASVNPLNHIVIPHPYPSEARLRERKLSQCGECGGGIAQSIHSTITLTGPLLFGNGQMRKVMTDDTSGSFGDFSTYPLRRPCNPL